MGRISRGLRRKQVRGVTSLLRNVNVEKMVNADAATIQTELAEATRKTVQSMVSGAITHNGFGTLVNVSSAGLSPKENLFNDSYAPVIDRWGVDDNEHLLHATIVKNCRCGLTGFADDTGPLLIQGMTEFYTRLYRCIVTFGSRELEHFEMPMAHILDSAVLYHWDDTGAAEVLTEIANFTDGRRGMTEFPGEDAIPDSIILNLTIRDPAAANEVLVSWGSDVNCYLTFYFDGERVQL